MPQPSVVDARSNHDKNQRMINANRRSYQSGNKDKIVINAKTPSSNREIASK